MNHVSSASVALLVCLLASHVISASEVIRAEIDATQVSRHLLRGKIRLPAKPGTFSLRHPEWIPGIHGPSEQIRNIGGLHVYDADGNQLAWQRDRTELTRFTVEVPEDSDYIVVDLVYLANQPTRVSTGVDSFGNADLLALNLHTCLVYPENVDVRTLSVHVQVTVPPEFQIASALRGQTSLGGQKFDFETTTFETLVDSPLIAGRHYRQLKVEVPGFPIAKYHFVCETPKGLDFDEAWADNYRRLMEEAYALFGSAPFASYDFLVVCSDDLPGMGLEHHESSLNGIDQRALTDEDKKKGRAVYLLGHELVHAWCGKYRRPAGMYRENYHDAKETGELWIYEGLTQYLGQVLTARAGFLTFEEHLERTAARYGYLANRTGRSWRPLEDTAIAAHTLRGGSPHWTDLRRSQDYYDEGAFFWLEADTIIRKATEGEKSLDDFCQRFFAADENSPKVKSFELQEVIRILTEQAEYDWQGLIDRRIRAASETLSRSAVRGAGYTYQMTDEKPGYFQQREKARESIHAEYSLGVVAKKTGEVTSVVPQSIADQAGLANGMKLRGVNGKRFTKKRLEEAIADSASQSKIELLVEEGEAYRVVALSYAAGARYPSFVRTAGQDDLLRAICQPRISRATPRNADSR